ncbi:hypothetical protein J437_LFUL007430 [Ladona fulva]|uniref:Chondroitin sulfate proteoglycan 4 n=1 Tax=Ladona fulva TaxID=123851 RepID=A0A8K0K335_LADFU|nr:hypothetical protein J437_LFUL007430 [Ladona fulva]
MESRPVLPPSSEYPPSNSCSVSSITRLSFTTNAEDQGLEVRYDVTQAPQYGVLQRLRGGASGGAARWQAVDHFTSRQIARDQIRYLHTTGEPEHDLFKFKVSVMEARNPTVYDFRIKFVELRLEHIRNLELTMDGIQEIPIAEENLLYQTKPTPTDPSRIVYHLLRSTRYGALSIWRSDSSNPKQQHRRLQPGDTFTQRDLTDSRLRYKLHHRTYSRAHDEFQFRVTTPDLSTEPAVFSIAHIPGPDEYSAVTATVERLEVLEGGRATIMRRHLHLQTDRVFDVSYNVTRGPHHGHLDVLDSTLTETLRHNASWFDSREIAAEKLVYVHDDSESKRDSFHFVALGDNFQYVGVFHIEIVLKNDNTPTRAVNRVFRVVSGGERLLTGRDLRYEDEDIDSRPSEIIYTRRGIPNGSLVSASDPSKPVFEFSQEDLNEGRVLFRHEGEDYGKIGLWITDGQFYANGILEVRASPPFVEITNATGLVVRRGGIATITSYNLSVETNVNAFGEQVQYLVEDGPRHGRLEVLGRSADKFTERDLEEGRLTYRHDGTGAVRDHFQYRVEARGEASVEGRFDIRIFPASYWEPLVVTSNRTLEVEESTSVCICSNALKVMHPQIPPGDITFFVQKPPMNGYLEIEDNNAITDDFPDEVTFLDGESSAPPPSPSSNPISSVFQDEVTLFDQSLIDDSRLQYIQAVANATDDHFVLDATNGISWLRGLVVKLVVVPKNIFISSSGDISVTEGGSVTLPGNLLVVLTGYYAGRVQEYRVVQQPSAGTLRATHRPGKAVDKFTKKQLEEGQILYQHDGSETMEDEFAVMGRAGEKESIAATVRIVVIPVNDEPPKLTNNTGLELWEGASATVTNSHLE